jgi:hypothetical protein
MKKQESGFCHSAKHTAAEKDLVEELSRSFQNSPLSPALRLQNFARHVRRQDIARFLAKFELFKLALPAHGNVIECGVFAGGGVVSWLHFSSILEPYNHTRRIIGFDTFAGFGEIDEADKARGTSEHLHSGALYAGEHIQAELSEIIALHDRNRPLGHIPKIELVKGDACTTIPQYLEDHPSLLVSLMYLDFDLYQPTKAALEHLLPRVVKGGVVAFDELNCPEFPGETTALLNTLNLDSVELRRLPFDPYISWFIK